MSVMVAGSAALASAVAYGIGTAGQHSAAYCGEVDAKGLADLLRNPRWLSASFGDVAGILLQIVALAYGPVVLVQPLLVLSLPVAVLVGPWFGLGRPNRVALVQCGVLVAGLGLFLSLLGQPHRGHIIGGHAVGWISLTTLILGLLAIGLTRRFKPVPRAVVFGVVAGCCFGVVSVLLDAVSTIWEVQGVRGFAHLHGLVPLTSVIVLAVGGYLLVQVGFQLGPLGASFPANLILDPLVAVVLGAALLGERVPLGGLHVAGYLVALAAVSWAAVKLAQPRALPQPQPVESMSGRTGS